MSSRRRAGGTSSLLPRGPSLPSLRASLYYLPSSPSWLVLQLQAQEYTVILHPSESGYLPVRDEKLFRKEKKIELDFREGLGLD